MNRKSPFCKATNDQFTGNAWVPKNIQEYARGPCGHNCSYVFCFGLIDNYLGWNCSHGTWCIPKQLPRNYNGINEPIMMNSRSWADIADDES
jgi:hypothetical protein